MRDRDRSDARLGHIHLKVRDLERAVSFYTQLLDFRVTETVGNQFVFLSGSTSHHELALRGMGPDAPVPPPHAVGLYHVAFEVPDRRALARVFSRLTESGVSVRPVDHGISWALYLSDPDGNGLEVYCDTRGEPGGRQVWHGESLPLSPETILADLPDK